MRNIILADMTLKTARQGSAVQLSFKEKIEIAKLLDRVGAPVIEVSAIDDPQVDALLIKSIANLAAQAVVSVPVAHSEAGVDSAWEAVRGAKRPRLQVAVPVSPVQMEYSCHKKPAAVLEMIDMLVRRCRTLCGEVEFLAEDATRAEQDFLYRAVDAAIAAGATVVSLADTAGTMLPSEFGHFIGAVKEAVPACGQVSLGAACGDELGMAVACAVSAIRAGADEIKVSCCTADCPGMGAMSQIIRARGDACSVYTDIRVTELQRTIDQIRWMAETERSRCSPFDHGVGKAQQGGALSAHDDLAAVAGAVQKLGYDLSEDDMAKVYEAFCHIAAKKEVSLPELEVIVATNALQVPPTYKLRSYVINAGNVIAASAQIELEKDGRIMPGICVGDGPIDAAFLTIEQIIGHHYELDDFQIQAVTEGREAMGAALVRLRAGGKLYAGQGISTDVIGASIHAYMNALNKIVYEEM